MRVSVTVPPAMNKATQASEAMRNGNKKRRSRAAQELARLRNKKATREQVISWCSNAGKAAWAGMSRAEIVIEMQRRRKIGLKRKIEAALAKLQKKEQA